MSTLSNNNLFIKLRARFQFLTFQNYSISVDDEMIRIKYFFNLSDQYVFEPEIQLPLRPFFNLQLLYNGTLEPFIFNLGMIELISYWKCACPAEVRIMPFQLNESQISWWKNLYFNGLGEFFYTNGITTDVHTFMQINSLSNRKTKLTVTEGSENTVLLPLGGGKDSIVSLEILKNTDFLIFPLIVNPRGATLKTLETAGFSVQEAVIIQRNIDLQLIKLNTEGFLNGHTPFSAMLAFLASLTAVLTGTKHIALSNESSANESTVPGSLINHQYSKSFAFEEDFRTYAQQYLHSTLNYFSLLRPLNELQIGKLFSRNHQYFKIFKSCNVGSKTDSWCCNCPKCLFTWLILRPFVPATVLNSIFGKDLTNLIELRPILEELLGNTETKPFECVGTVDEVLAATNFLLATEPALHSTQLFSKHRFTIEIQPLESLLKAFNTEHYLQPVFENLLQKALYDSENN